jgi:tRNA-dihydrouridine synthase A
MPQLPEDSHRFCIAPMLDWTDRHARFFLRLFSKQVRLYTEMVTANAINFGDSARFLQFNDEEHPVALQLGGSDPDALIKACHTASPYGYDEINLNVGCPSDRVQSGRFGACLMLNPVLVADCYQAMVCASTVPISIKCRIGVDDQDSEAFLHTFIQTLYDAGCRIFIIHARKAWLKGLSPKQNREIPPLHYDRVYRIKTQFPDAKIIINGGINTLTETTEHLAHCDGVMMGREAYHNPYILANIDQELFNIPTPIISREDILRKMVIYIEQECQKGVKLNHITRHMLGLYHGMPGARQFRRQLSGRDIQAGIREIRKAL